MSRPLRIHSVLSCFALCVPMLAQAATPDASPAPLVTVKDKMSYATGVMTARNLLKNDVPFDLELLIQGLRDVVADRPVRLSEREIKVLLQSMQADITRRLSNERQVKAALARESGIRFVKDYRSKPGVVTLPGDLMYRVLSEGKGDKPTEAGTVVVRYRGTLVDGTEFEAIPEGKTVTVSLPEVITGWREVLKRVPAGSHIEMVVPPSLAYGSRGSSNIGPNETLVFDLDLVAVVK